jgi:hypothetical protein
VHPGVPRKVLQVVQGTIFGVHSVGTHHLQHFLCRTFWFAGFICDMPCAGVRRAMRRTSRRTRQEVQRLLHMSPGPQHACTAPKTPSTDLRHSRGEGEVAGEEPGVYVIESIDDERPFFNTKTCACPPCPPCKLPCKPPLALFQYCAAPRVVLVPCLTLLCRAAPLRALQRTDLPLHCPSRRMDTMWLVKWEGYGKGVSCPPPPPLWFSLFQ